MGYKYINTTQNQYLVVRGEYWSRYYYLKWKILLLERNDLTISIQLLYSQTIHMNKYYKLSLASLGCTMLKPIFSEKCAIGS